MSNLLLGVLRQIEDFCHQRRAPGEQGKFREKQHILWYMKHVVYNYKYCGIIYLLLYSLARN